MPLPTIPSGNVFSSLPTGYNIDNSCRMTRGSSTKFERTISSDGTDPKKWTLNYWMKRGTVNASESMAMLFNKNSGGTRVGNAGELNANNKLYFYNYDGSGEPATITSAVLRDPSAWYNIHLIWDTANATAGDRMRTFINGTEVTAFDTDTNPPLNEESMLFEGSQCTKLSIGYHPYNNSMYFDGYIAQVIACDGQAYLPTKFGEFNEDSPTIFQPIDPSKESLSFGTHGFWLDFKDSSALGNDVSGNNNDFTPANLDATDQSTDSPTNNFCVFNVLNPTFTGTNSEGNCKHLSTSSAWRAIYGTIPFTTGKWYAEFKMVADGSSAGPGVINIDDGGDTFRLGETNRGLGQGENAVAYLSNAQILDGGNTIKTGQTTWTDGDILGVAIDATNGFVYWHKNGTYLDGAKTGTDVGDPTSAGSGTGGYPLADLISANGTYLFGVGGDDAWNVEANFGGCPAFTVSSANADANGYGKFEYSVPSGYYALCTKNLAEFG